MPIRIVRSVVIAGTPPAALLSEALATPTTVGDTLQVLVRYDPARGVPAVSDTLGNRYELVSIASVSPSLSLATFFSCLSAGGGGHVVTASTVGGQPGLSELMVNQLTVFAANLGPHPTLGDIALAALNELSVQSALLQRLVAAERA